MDETTSQIRSEGQKKSTDASLIKFTRNFRAPVERLWAAWSQAEMIKQWWGPKDYTCPKAEIDFKEGGKCLLAMQSPKGDVCWSVGIYSQIIPNQKIISTDQFSNDKGQAITPQEAGMEEWPGDYRGSVMIQFEKIGEDQTKMTIQHAGIPAQMQDDCKVGWATSIDKLQALVEHH